MKVKENTMLKEQGLNKTEKHKQNCVFSTWKHRLLTRNDKLHHKNAK